MSAIWYKIKVVLSILNFVIFQVEGGGEKEIITTRPREKINPREKPNQPKDVLIIDQITSTV